MLSEQLKPCKTADEGIAQAERIGHNEEKDFYYPAAFGSLKAIYRDHIERLERQIRNSRAVGMAEISRNTTQRVIDYIISADQEDEVSRMTDAEAMEWLCERLQGLGDLHEEIVSCGPLAYGCIDWQAVIGVCRAAVDEGEKDEADDVAQARRFRNHEQVA